MSAFLALAFGVVLAMSAQFTFAVIDGFGSRWWGLALVAVGVISALARVRLGPAIREISEPANLAIASAMMALFWIGLPGLRWLVAGLVLISVACSALLIAVRDRRPSTLSLFDLDDRETPREEPARVWLPVGSLRRPSAAGWEATTSSAFPFAIDLLFAAPFILGSDHSFTLSLSLLLSPWLLVAIGVIHLPILAAALRGFRLDPRVSRNHALKHATIHFLRATGLRGVGGHAERSGFRLHGRGASPHAIQDAFGRVSTLVRRGEPLPCVSPRCGSNRITAAGFGLLLVLAATGLALLLAPPLSDRVVLFVGTVLLFAVLRNDVAVWAQGHFFLATDFRGTWIRAIRGVKPHFGETAPVFFVKTIVTH